MNPNIIIRTLNQLEHIHLLGIELEHPIFGFERSNIELRTFVKLSFELHLVKISLEILRYLNARFLPFLSTKCQAFAKIQVLFKSVKYPEVSENMIENQEN